MAMLSSPLAAMQPPPCPTGRAWGCGQDSREVLSRNAASNSFGRASGYNFADLAMGKDYFTHKPAAARGSSPTASLAADLSQNFYIDQSPQFPTPRRSLFTSGLFSAMNRQEGVTTPPIKDYVESGTTPQVPSSSPGGGFDAMDMSPLPHKLPFANASRPFVDSTSQKVSDNDMISPTNPTPNLHLDAKTSVFDRRRPIFHRASFSRSKFMSTSNIHSRSKEPQLPPFTFGAGSSEANNESTMTLDDAFSESPSQDRNLFANPLPCLTRPRFQLTHTSTASRGNGSPFNGLVKKTAVAPVRPRKQIRRSLSMFQHPEDVMKNEKKDNALDSIMDIDEVYQLKVPHFIPEDKPDSLPRINQDTMISVLNGDFGKTFDQVRVIDCRFEYEYNGGHIDGADNFNDKEKLAQHLFKSDSPTNTLLILHCEYSAHRAPLMAQYIRQQDRAVNALSYPRLTYPEMYILDGGYSSFFKTHRVRCYPQNYVEMDAKEHEQACERGLNRIKLRSKLNRAQTYSFGQHSLQVHNSPSRPSSSSNKELEGDDLLAGRMHTRRMASFP